MLDDGGQTTRLSDRSKRLGFLPRGGELAPGAIHTRIPEHLTGSEQSVCGVKGFLVDERRSFTDGDGNEVTVDCAKVAALDIVDSPVHVHGETLETYHIIAGHGRMVLDEEVVEVGPGSFIVIPPGVEHGLCSDDPERALRVVMTFTPGLAPVSAQAWRDERIVADRASARLGAPRT